MKTGTFSIRKIPDWESFFINRRNIRTLSSRILVLAVSTNETEINN